MGTISPKMQNLQKIKAYQKWQKETFGCVRYRIKEKEGKYTIEIYTQSNFYIKTKLRLVSFEEIELFIDKHKEAETCTVTHNMYQKQDS